MPVPYPALVKRNEQLGMLFSFAGSGIVSAQFTYFRERSLQHRQVVRPQGGIQFMSDFVDHVRELGRKLCSTRYFLGHLIRNFG